MEKIRKIRCDCGGVFATRQTTIEGIVTEALVCPQCGYVTLTQAQTEKLMKLKRLQDILHGRRKVIRIGNSMGITLPQELQEFGIRAGQTVHIEALGERAFKLSIRSS